MVYTTPPTFVASNVLTAAQLNTYLRDNFKALGDAWTAYGSGSSWTASTTNPTLGNGTWSGGYIEVGKFIAFRAEVTMGSTTTFGAGTYSLALPAPASSSVVRLTLEGNARDTSAAADYLVGGVITAGATAAALRFGGNPWTNLTPAAPFTFANTDVLSLDGVYERG